MWPATWNHKISKCIAEFHPEERATLVVLLWKSFIGDIGISSMMKKILK